MMEHKGYWRRKLTPYDSELLLMVESITKMPCEAKADDNGYFFEADYEKLDDPAHILALWDAIEGRVGERLVSIRDDSERHRLVVRVRFDAHEYPSVFYGVTKEPRLWVGDACLFGGKRLNALQVCGKNAERLFDFVGCGQYVEPVDGPAYFEFLNASRSVYQRAEEGKCVVALSESHFAIVNETEIEWEGCE